MSNGKPGYHEGLTDAQITTLFKSIEELKDKIDALTQEVSALKQWRWQWGGAVAVLCFGITLMTRFAWR